MNEDQKLNDAFQALDQEKIKEDLSKDIEQKVSARAEQLVNEKLGKFAKAITGEESNEPALPWEQRGADKPADWREVMDSATKLAEEKILSKLTEKEKAEKAERDRILAEQSENKTKAEQEMYKQWDQDWNELVADGLMPGVSDEVAQKIRAGVKDDPSYATDPGLLERIKLLGLAKKNNTTPYKAYHKYYTRESDGKAAPIAGGGRVQGVSNERSYEDIHSEAMKLVF